MSFYVILCHFMSFFVIFCHFLSFYGILWHFVAFRGIFRCFFSIFEHLSFLRFIRWFTLVNALVPTHISPHRFVLSRSLAEKDSLRCEKMCGLFPVNLSHFLTICPIAFDIPQFAQSPKALHHISWNTLDVFWHNLTILAIHFEKTHFIPFWHIFCDFFFNFSFYF